MASRSSLHILHVIGSLSPAAGGPPEAVRQLVDAYIEVGDEIELATPSGTIRVRANLSELGQAGVVHMYHGCPEADVNTLLEPDYLDPISGFPGFKALLCSVRKVGPPPGAGNESQAAGAARKGKEVPQ